MLVLESFKLLPSCSDMAAEMHVMGRTLGHKQASNMYLVLM
jgi:hypothetical protein